MQATFFWSVRFLLNVENYYNNRPVRAQYAAYPTTQTGAVHLACVSHMQMPGGFREAIHFRYNLVSWPMSEGMLHERVFA